MRTLALDIGDATIGMAISDPLGITAQGLPTYYRQAVKADVKAIEAICLDRDVDCIVYGLPLYLDGNISPQAEKTERFVKQLKKRLNYGGVIDWSIDFQAIDERLTSAQAESIMKLADLTRKQRAKHVDRMAAQLILESYLETRTP